MAADFELNGQELRVVVGHVLAAATEVLPVFESVRPDDLCPRAALEAAREFVGGARRSRLQRVAALDAHRAAAVAPTEVARLAAQAAGDAAAAAYLHPIASSHQVGHILRADAAAARIAELQTGDAQAALERTRARATPALLDVLRRYPPVRAGGSRIAQLMAALDASMRS
ncbi:putative immunity protein [Mycolicibacterium phlei]